MKYNELPVVCLELCQLSVTKYHSNPTILFISQLKYSIVLPHNHISVASIHILWSLSACYISFNTMLTVVRIIPHSYFILYSIVVVPDIIYRSRTVANEQKLT